MSFELIKHFEHSEFGSLDVILIDGKPYFPATECARILGYADPHKAVKQHTKEDGWANRPVIDKLGREQQMKYITEGNLYRLITRSKLLTAEKFERWVFDEVVPTVREYGMYATPETVQRFISDPLVMLTTLQALVDTREKALALKAENEALTTQCAAMKPKADYFDELVDRNLLTNFRDTAKELHIKQTDFIDFLLDFGFVYRDTKGALKPYAEKNNGLFELKEGYNSVTGWKGVQTMITPKGRETFRLLLEGKRSRLLEAN